MPQCHCRQKHSLPALAHQALQHILNAMQILCARDAVVAVLAPHGSTPGCALKKADAAANAAAASATVTPAGTLNMEAAEVMQWLPDPRMKSVEQ